MDPDANLKEQLELAQWLQEHDEDELGAYSQKADRLAELVIALDAWIKKGGFLPHAWKPVAPRAKSLPIRRRSIVQNEDGEDFVLSDGEEPGGKGRW